jgi:hypothetical protein
MGYQRDAEAVMASASYKPSRLVADFYLIFAEEKAADEVLPQHVGFLYEALMSAETDTLRVGLSLDGSDPNDPSVSGDEGTEGEFVLTYFHGARGEEIVRTITFRTSIQPQTRVMFNRQLRDATIVVPCVLVLGNNGQEFIVGPRVDARCGTLEINASTLIVPSDREFNTGAFGTETGVILEANHYSGSVNKRPIVRGSLSVAWPGAEAFPWTEFYTRVENDALTDVNLREAYRRFSRIVMTLRSHKRGQLARRDAKIENSRVLQGELGEALLSRLVTDGILRLDERVYVWVPEIADSVVGISWHDLRLGRSSPTLNRYLTSFMREFRS